MEYFTVMCHVDYPGYFFFFAKKYSVNLVKIGALVHIGKMQSMKLTSKFYTKLVLP
jgi:hypothetical protein